MGRAKLLDGCGGAACWCGEASTEATSCVWWGVQSTEAATRVLRTAHDGDLGGGVHGGAEQKAANMAMVLDAFASYMQNMLTEMVKEEVYMLLGVGDEIERMDVKLRDLKNFLADADRRNVTDKSVQEWVAQLKRAMYEAADILDLCQLKAMEHRLSTKDVGCFNPLLFCMRNPSHAHDIGTRIKVVNKRLGVIKERSAAFSFIPLGSYEDRSSKIMLSEKEGNTNIMVVAVVGVGRIGKTTLAQKVFNDEALNNEFEKTIWLSINKDFDEIL
ncbi:Disease resistance protein RGA2 [Triticum urartu]|uniref:Disease resistance protein RGA2 n=1 Tax=Triticum urartu TaxID=4572 RepID=M7ZTH0_TRIUA|nr:Disease resistance protein RGA2 [Triticum urartu]